MPIADDTRKLPTATPETIARPEAPRQITTQLPPARTLPAAQQPQMRKIYSGWTPPVREQIATGPDEMVAPDRGVVVPAGADELAALRAEVAELRARLDAAEQGPTPPPEGAPAEQVVETPAPEAEAETAAAEQVVETPAPEAAAETAAAEPEEDRPRSRGNKRD